MTTNTQIPAHVNTHPALLTMGACSAGLRPRWGVEGRGVAPDQAARGLASLVHSPGLYMLTNLCAINKLEAKPRSLPPTHPNLRCEVSQSLRISSSSSTSLLLFPDLLLLSFPSSPSAPVSFLLNVSQRSQARGFGQTCHFAAVDEHFYNLEGWHCFQSASELTGLEKLILESFFSPHHTSFRLMPPTVSSFLKP